MDKKKVIILAVILIFIVGLGVFVFANPSNESLNDNNNTNDNDVQNDDNENLDDENTDGDGEEGEDGNTPTTDNDHESDEFVGNDEEQNDEATMPSTPSEPTDPNTPEEPVVDTSYENALAAVIKAESSLSQIDVDTALALVNALANSNNKTGLASRIQAVQNMINAILAVELAEETFTQDDVNIAKALIHSLVDSENKDDLTNRIHAVQNTIDVTSLVTELQEKTESATDKTGLDEARNFRIDEDVVAKVEALGESTKKEELIDTLNALALILDDTTPPVVSGILNGAIINDTSAISITDTNEVTILLGENVAELEDLTQNLLLDGEYTLVVTDAAFNSSEAITFEVDKTAPDITVDTIIDGISNTKNPQVHGTDINVFDLVIKLDGNVVTTLQNSTSYWYGIGYLTDGDYEVTATDIAGNTSTIKFTLDRTISEIVEIDSIEDLNSAIENQDNNQYWIINEGTYSLLQGTKSVNGQTGWFFPITANDLTIVGKGDVTIKAGIDVANGNWHTQNFVTIWGDNVQISNVTLIAQDDPSTGLPNKVIEILGDNTELTDVTVNPDTEDATDFGGTIYINKTGVTTTLTNVTLNKGRISLSGADNTNTLILANVTADLAGSLEEINWAFWNPNNAVVKASDFTVTASTAMTNVMNDFIAMLPVGTILILNDGTYELGHLEINNEINLKGTSSNTILNVSNDPVSGQAGIYVKKNGSMSDLTIVSATDMDALKVSGNSYASVSNYKISNITVTGGKSGINIHGVTNAVIDNVNISDSRGKSLSVASSSVTVSNSNIENAGWGSAITIEYNPSNLTTYPSPAMLNVGNGNVINGAIIVNYPINGNKVVFTDSTGWRETILGDNMIYYAPVTN